MAVLPEVFCRQQQIILLTLIFFYHEGKIDWLFVFYCFGFAKLLFVFLYIFGCKFYFCRHQSLLKDKHVKCTIKGHNLQKTINLKCAMKMQNTFTLRECISRSHNQIQTFDITMLMFVLQSGRWFFLPGVVCCLFAYNPVSHRW